MEGKNDLYLEIIKENQEGEFILFSLKGFLKHLKQIESFFFFSEIFSCEDFDKMTHVLRFLKRFLTFILKNAIITKRPPIKAIKGTYV